MKSQYSGSESESSSPGLGRFRVRVCMTRLFSDERARALVMVSARRRVRWLQRRLSALFALPPRCVLLCQGHLLPPGEQLAILHRDDVVDVIPPCVGADACANWNLVGGDSIISCNTSATETKLGDPDCGTLTQVDRNEYSMPAIPLLQADVVDSAICNHAKPSLAAQSNENDELVQRKRRALLMLDQVCREEEDPPCDARPRRRRVRRRRRAAFPMEADGGEEPVGNDEYAPFTDDGRATAPREQSRDMSVLRNGEDRSRPPRVIRAIGDDTSL